VYIGDRESDIYEFFCTAQLLGTHFLVRTCVDRLAGDGKHTIAAEMAEVRVRGLHHIEVRDKKGDTSEAILKYVTAVSEYSLRLARICELTGSDCF
jgi:hypothetical protein